jgi:hypothetical protein
MLGAPQKGAHARPFVSHRHAPRSTARFAQPNALTSSGTTVNKSPTRP